MILLASLLALVVGLAGDNSPKANAHAIQTAIDQIEAAGGGIVSVQAGTWVCGTIWMKSGVELHLESNAVIKASTNLDDFNALEAYPENWSCASEEWVGKHLIIAHSVTNIALTGPGGLDGSSDYYYEDKPRKIDPKATGWIYGMRKARYPKVGRLGQLVAIVRSRDVKVHGGFQIRYAPCWCLYCYGCEGVTIRDYIVRNGNTDGNTDGMDIDCCREVLIERADVITGDDALAIRASGRRFGDKISKHICENIVVRDCHFQAEAMGIRIGVGEGHIRNLTIEDVTVQHAGKGVSFESYYGVDRGNGVDIENVIFRRFETRECHANYRFRVGGDLLKFGVRNIHFEDCRFGAALPGVFEYAADNLLKNINFDRCVYEPVANNIYHGR